MRALLFFIILSPMPAFAHVGHLGEAAGHDHWIAGAAIGIAIGIGLWAAAKDRRSRNHTKATDAEADTSEEQSA